MSGDLQVKDLESAWNERFYNDFGYKVESAADGCLQDVHWSVGLFGYFPTYSLGNVYAGCLHEKLRQGCSNLDTELRDGNLDTATEWLRTNLQCHGALKQPRQTIIDACGFEPSEAPLLKYLQLKFTEIYDL